MLLAVQNYIREQQRVSFRELQQSFSLPPALLDQILMQLEVKGRIKKLPLKACPGCCHCSSKDFQIYEWCKLTQ